MLMVAYSRRGPLLSFRGDSTFISPSLSTPLFYIRFIYHFSVFPQSLISFSCKANRIKCDLPEEEAADASDITSINNIKTLSSRLQITITAEVINIIYGEINQISV